ncbi:MAG: hypothetical protein IK024_13825 [Treponema sp.]|nr:hypothetical protein [Treponema sp.]
MNKTEKVESYGYPSLGLITKFYRNCIGDEPLIHIETFLEENGDHPYKDKGSITKAWDRLCDETYSTFELYKPDSQDGLIFFVDSYFYFMNKEYQLSLPLIKLINSTFYCLFDLLNVHHDQPIMVVPDIPTKEILKTAIFSTLINWAYGIKKDFNNWEHILDFYLSGDLNYSTVLQGIKEEKKQTWEEIYSELDNKVEKEKIKADKEIAERFENIIKAAIQNNKNPTWYNFWILFLWAPDELNEQLLEIYLLNNYKTSLKNVFNFTEDELQEIKKDFLEYLNGADEEELFKKYKPINDEERFAAAETYLKVFSVPELYLRKEKTIFNDIKNTLIKQAKENNYEIQHLFDFFEPWLFGYKAVAERRFGDAEKYYKQAFDNKYLAGDYILPFLKQAFVLELYNNGKWSKATQAAELDTNNTNPVCKQAQIYWNYGYALGLFDKPATETFLESFRIYQNFYNEFPPEIFEHPDNVRKLQLQDIATEIGIFFNDEEIPEQKLNKLYNYICDYEDGDKALNERVKHPYSNKDVNNKENRLYTPFSICVCFGTKKEEFLSLAEKWIDYKNLELGKRNFNNSTALLEAITQYNHLRFIADSKNDALIKRYRKLIFKIIDKSNVKDFTETKIHKIHVLQVAIDSFDIEIVESLINKGLDINNLVIDADELSPLYYAINRKERIRFGFDNFKKKLEENPYNITWNNFDMPGLTAGDKSINRELRIGKINNVSFDFKDTIMKASFEQMYGNEKTFAIQIQELDKIIEYLINKTDDIDKYEKSFDQYQGINTLFLAAEYNDVKLCELLLEKGASPTKSLGETLLCTIPNNYDSYDYVYSYNSFIYRLIYFHSWDMLEIFLSKHKEMAKKSMEPNEYGITPIIYFLYCTRTLDNAQELRKKYISMFIKAGADLNQKSILGSANQVIQLLEQKVK